MSGFQNSFRNRALRDFFTYQTKKMPYHSQVFARNPALGSISGALATLWPCQFLKIPSRHVPENPLSDFACVPRKIQRGILRTIYASHLPFPTF